MEQILPPSFQTHTHARARAHTHTHTHTQNWPLIGTSNFKNALHIPLTDTNFSVESLAISLLQTVDQW